MDTIRQATVGTATVTLEARDQYNDYSVVYDYSLVVVDRVHNLHRIWAAGRNKRDALELFERSLPIIRKLQA